MKKLGYIYFIIALLSLLICILPVKAVAQQSDKTNAKRYYFNQFSTKEGQFRYNINGFAQDNEGYVYSCSLRGLHIFNGYSFKILNQDTNPEFSNKPYCATDLGEGKILIGTLDKGLFIYDKQIEKITNLTDLNDKLKTNLSVRYLFIDDTNMIWAGCMNGRILKIQKEHILNLIHNEPLQYEYINVNPGYNVNSICQWNEYIFIGTDNGLLSLNNKKTGSPTFIQCIKPDDTQIQILSLHINNNRLWVGTNSGIVVLEQNKNQILSVYKQLLKNKIIKAIDSNTPDNVWVGSRENGLFNIILTPKGEEIQQYTYYAKERESINSNSIISIFIDNQDNLWLGTWYGGINRTNLRAPAFSTFFNAENENEIQKNITWCIEHSNTGGFWIGTHANGLNYYEGGNTYKTVIFNEEVHSISSLLEIEESKLLFVGTWGNGIKVFDSNSLTEKKAFNKVFASLSKDRIYSLVKDNNIIWIGSYTGGLFRYNIAKNELKNIKFNTADKVSAARTDVRSLYSDGNYLWIGSIHTGLFKLTHDNNGNIISTKQISLPSSSTPNLRITSIIKKDKHLICTTEDGLFEINENDSIFPIIPEMKGKLCSHAQYDESGNLWISTYSGLFRYSFSTNKLSVFFKDLSFYRFLCNPKNKKIFACSNNGLYQFKPEDIFQQKSTPEVHITSLKIFDNTIYPGEKLRGKTILDKNPNYLNTLVLPHFCNSFSFDLQILDLSSNPDNAILYKMSGMDKEWHNRNANATNISYTNIPAGEYKFLVKAAGSNNAIESKTKVLTIIKLKPWWFSNLAFAGYFILLLFIVYYFIKETKTKMKIRNELKLEKLSKEREDELNKQKLAFFTNVSHELRTPLTLILAPLEELIEKNSSDYLAQPLFKTIHKNTVLLQRLINQILDFRKIEKAEVEVNLHQINLPHFISEILYQFKETADKKKIEIEYEPGAEEIWWAIDPYKFESIVYNLMSNSLKFTNKYGRIIIQTERDKDGIKLQFQDTGIGINRNDLPRIFDRFYQSKQSGKQQGTGIGLALVKKYVEIHNGIIEVESTKGTGTTFEIFLEHDEKINLNELPYYSEEKDSFPQNKDEIEKDDELHTKPKYLVLVVDDNDDILNYVSGLLKEHYRVLTADNATDALDLAKRKYPNLIISDIMMEGVDGYELCKQLKQNIGTSHIPIILLTAKKGIEPKIKGIETGADAYIEKPFNVKLLLTQITELIKHREKLKTRYSLIDSGHKDISPTSVDEGFLNEILVIIDQHIQDAQLTVNTIADEMKISHDQLYRKIKSLSGLSANQFIRLTRLKKAIAMFQKGSYNVSEVGYQVGFNSPSYFAKCFKDEFGISPTEFVEQLLNSTSQKPSD